MIIGAEDYYFLLLHCFPKRARQRLGKQEWTTAWTYNISQVTLKTTDLRKTPLQTPLRISQNNLKIIDVPQNVHKLLRYLETQFRDS